MRVLLLTSQYLPRIGGVQLAVHNLAEGLFEAGHEVHLLAPRPRDGASPPAALHRLHWFAPLRATWRLGLWIPAWRTRLRRLIRRLAPDIVHAHVAYPAGHVAAGVCRKARIPMVLTCHGNDIQRLPEIGYGMRLDPRLDPLITAAVRQASGLIAIGSDVRAEYLSLGIPPDRIADLPNGINASLLADRDPAAKRRLGLPEDAVALLAVGRNHPKKGFAFLLEAMRHVADRDAKVVCVIVGARVPELQPRVDALGLAEQVFLFGPAPPVGVRLGDAKGAEARTDTYFHAADVFVMPSLIESFGLVTVEALAAGLPVVAMDAEGSRDLLAESPSTRLVKDRTPEALSGALLGLVEGVRRDPGLGRTNPGLAAPYDRRRVAEQHAIFYQSVLERVASGSEQRPAGRELSSQLPT